MAVLNATEAVTISRSLWLRADSDNENNAPDQEDECKRIAEIGRVGAERDIRCNLGQAFASNDEERTDDEWREQRTHLADHGTDGKKHKPSDDQSRGSRTETFALGDGDDWPDIDGISTEQERNAAANPEQSQGRDQRPYAAAQHDARHHGPAKVGRQVQQIADH